MTFLDRFFGLKLYGTTVRKEFVAALTTFLSMSYVIFVNPTILSHAGMPRLALITSTILVTVIGTLLVAFIPKLPMAIAPGMALNAFFVYSLVLGQKIPWQQALAAVFLSGVILTLLSFLHFQKRIMQYFPESIKIGSMAGIGFFLTLVGLNNMGIIKSNSVTLMQLAPLTPQVVLGLLGFLLMAILSVRKIPGAIVISIILCTVVSVTLGYSPAPAAIASAPPSIQDLLFKIDFSGVWRVSFIMPLFTLMFVDLFDSMATLSANIEMLPFPSTSKKNEALNKVFKVDAINSSIGALMGNSTTTIYLESLSGIIQGGRTGLTALFIALFFLIALFFTPLIAIVPSHASSGALLLIGISMAEMLKRIDFTNIRVAVPTYATALMMPFTYNISTGIIFGFLSYFLIELFCGNIFKVHWINWVVTLLCLVNLLSV